MLDRGEGSVVEMLREKNLARLGIRHEKINLSQKGIAICITKRKERSECRQRSPCCDDRVQDEAEGN